MIVPIVPLAAGPAIGLGLLVGGFAGLVHFTQLRHALRPLTDGRTGLALAALLLRVALSAVLLAALMRCGLAALAAGFAGFLIARSWALQRERPP